MLLMGKSTISTGPFSIANCNKLPEGSWRSRFTPVFDHIVVDTAIQKNIMLQQCSWCLQTNWMSAGWGPPVMFVGLETP